MRLSSLKLKFKTKEMWY